MSPPDPKLVFAAVEQVLHLLRTAVGTLRMYSMESPVSQNALGGLHAAMIAVLQDYETILINDTEAGLMLDGKQPLRVKGIHEILAAHRVRNLKLLKGITLPEISALCEGFGKRIEDLAPHKDFNSWLVSRGVEHIQTDDIRYIEVREDEKVVLRGKGQFAVDDPSGLIQSVKDTLSNISKVPDASYHDILREEFVKEMSQLPVDRLQELFTHKEAQSGPIAGMLDNLTQSMPMGKIEEVIRFVAERQHQIKVQIQSQSERMQRLSVLKTFLKQVLRAPASREIPPELYAYLSSLGLLEHVQGGLKAGEHFSFAAVAKNLMGLPSAFLVTVPLRDHTLELVKTLASRDQDDPLKQLIFKVFENLENFDDAVRSQTVTALMEMHTTLAIHKKMAISERIVHMLTKLADTERILEVYKSFAAALVSMAMDLVVQGHHERSASILSLLRRQSHEDYALPEGRHAEAYQALQQFSLRSTEALCTDLNSGQVEQQTGALQVLIEMGEVAVDPLVEILRRSTNPRAQQAAFQALGALGLSSGMVLLERLEFGEPAKVIMQVLPILTPFATSDMLPKLLRLLQHPDGGVRREAISVISHIKDRSIPDAVILLLKDPDPRVQAASVRCIGQLKPPKAAETLMNMLEGSLPPVQEEIVAALGIIQNPIAIPALIECLGGHSGLLSKKPLFSDAVRVRAATALSEFLTDPRARRALEDATRDSAPLLRQTAMQVLNTYPAY